jgi:hypothetical protein
VPPKQFPQALRAHYRAQLAGLSVLDDRSLYDIGYSRTELSVPAWRRAGVAAG